MLIKEYRIPLPLTVEEYRIAQLYMIAKKSREESKGAGSGVEILINEPYQDGPGGNGGQYTRKIYHIGSHLPGWFKSLIPKSALTVEEEAWNAYPYTKTRYTCPFVEKFSLEIETYYYADNGFQDNVFKLSGSDLRNRIVDLIDVVKDQLYGADYLKEEDPKMYISSKTGRGPLSDNWLQEYWLECKGKNMPTANGKGIMCAYKLCRVEFRYWGMQTKLEKFIHDVALRKTMLRAHRQAWAWQDEWHGLTMDDIREIERQTQEALKLKMGTEDASEGSTEDDLNGLSGGSNGANTPEDAKVGKALTQTLGSIEKNEEAQSPPITRKADASSSKTGGVGDAATSLELNIPRHQEEVSPQLEGRRRKWSRSNSKAALHSPTGSGKGFDLHIDKWRMESIRRESDSGSEDEFFDCQEESGDSSSLAKWSSLDLLTEEDLDAASPTAPIEKQDSIFSHSYLQRVTSERGRPHLSKLNIDPPCPGSPVTHSTCSTTILVLVLHAGSVLDANVDLTAKKSDITTFRGAFESVMRQHYPSMVGHIAVRLVSCSSICTEALGILSSLSPYSFDVSPSCTDAPHITHDSIPIGAIPLFATSSAEYQDAVSRAVAGCNSAYQEFVKSDEGKGFNGRVVFVGDSMGSILAYDTLCRTTQYSSRHDSENSILDTDVDLVEVSDKHLTAPAPRRRSSSTSDQSHCCKLDFEVSDLFMFGSPLSLVLSYRKISTDDKSSLVPRPSVAQVYNLFHATDPFASRLEPLMSSKFTNLLPVNVPRYQKYPLGDGQPYHLLEVVQANPQLFAEGLCVAPTTSGIHLRRMSEVSIQSTMSGLVDALPLHTINSLTQRWWGTKRLDYALYCPDGLANFPTNALPHLFHASYWESLDVIAFILRQLGRFDVPVLGSEDKELACFSPSQPCEKWMRKRTSVKLKNVAANHRANDVIVKEGLPQVLVARFMYGPFDVITLTGEKVDIHLMKDYPAGEWIYVATEVTDKTGRATHTLSEGKSLGYGMYPIKMVVRGDHTSVDFFMAVIPPKTECVVFSIDGSFAGSMSMTGRDPKVRPGAVDVVRHWQEIGYIIIYVTGRPDMQQHKVVSWLSQHNFPYGLLSFADGLSTDFLSHKAHYLKNLINDHGVVIHAAYGSQKDISVYSSIGLKPKQIYIVGKVSKKHQSQATVLADGYVAHLVNLMSHGGSRPAQGNARMVIPRGCFGLPGQNASLRRRRSAKRATSYPLPGNAPEGEPTTPAFSRSFSRRKSPRPPHSAPAERL